MESAAGENEKRILAATVRERLIGDKNIILYRDLINQNIPTFLNNYLQNSVQKIIHTEEPVQFNNSKRFDFEYSKIIELKNSLIKAFEEAIIFSREELSEIINRTVSLQFNLLVKPEATLLKIFYKNRADRIQIEVLQILNGLDDQRILIQALIKNIKEFDQYHIVEEDFKNILHRTNKEVYQENFISSFISDVSAFADFLTMIHGYENKKIDVKLLKLLVIERNLKQYLPAFDIYQDNRIDIDNIDKILKNFINNKKEENEESDFEVDEIDNFMMISIKEDQKDDLLEKRSKLYKNEIDQSFERSGEFNDKISRPNEDTNHEACTILDDDNDKKFPKITNIGKDPLDIIITRSKIEEQPGGPLYSLRGLIDEKSKRFIKKRIFDNDSRAYNEFIKQLEVIDNWKEAKKVIDRELFMRSIKPYSKEALRLGDIVFNRYFPKKH